MEKETNEILEPIPKLSAKQKAFRPDKRKDAMPLYKLRREPTQFEDIIDCKTYRSRTNMSIWRDNHTLICVGPSARRQNGERRVFFTIYCGKRTLECCIYGKKDSAVAETLALFWSLPYSGASRVEFFATEKRSKQDFKFTALSPEQLERILDANPTRHWEFHTGIWSAEQSVIFATRPYPLHLKLTDSLGTKNGFGIRDCGTSFTDALQARQSSFGTLCLDFDWGEMPFSGENLFRLSQLDIFEKLSCSYLNDMQLVLRPFSVKVNALDYEVHASYINLDDFDALNIVTKDLNFRLYLENDRWSAEGLMIAFLNRVATLGHFERFGFAIDCSGHYRQSHGLERVALALVCAIVTNTKLTYLNLGDSHWRFDWVPHLQKLFQAFEAHPRLRTVVMSERNWEEANYSQLAQLLSRNRDLVVLDHSGKRISNGPTVDNAYLLNHIHYGSTNLLKDSTALRPWLMEMALMRSASKKFPHTALLLSNHADALCESLLLVVNQEESIVAQQLPEDAASPASASSESSRGADRLKRKRIVEQSAAAKKAARNET